MSAIQNISVLLNTQRTITVNLPANLSGSTTLTTISVSQREFETSVLFQVTGSTTGSQTVFTTSAGQNNIQERVYFYSVDILAGGIAHQITKGGYNVLSIADAEAIDYLENMVSVQTPTYYYNKTEINAYTGNTAIALGGKLNTLNFNSYSGATAIIIGGKLSQINFNAYSGNTAIALGGK